MAFAFVLISWLTSSSRLVVSTDIEAVFFSSDSAEPAGGTSEWHESRRDAASQHAFQDSTCFSSPADVGAEHIEPSHQPREWASVAAGDRFKSNLWHQTAFNRFKLIPPTRIQARLCALPGRTWFWWKCYTYDRKPVLNRALEGSGFARLAPKTANVSE